MCICELAVRSALEGSAASVKLPHTTPVGGARMPESALPLLGQLEEASRVLLATGGLRAQPGQSELPAVGRFLNSCMYRLMLVGMHA
jgi:hypothetical protein